MTNPKANASGALAVTDGAVTVVVRDASRGHAGNSNNEQKNHRGGNRARRSK